jgi:gliding motility-associated-like protein
MRHLYLLILWLLSNLLFAHKIHPAGPEATARFVKNQGQWEAEVGFRLVMKQAHVYIHKDGYTVFLLNFTDHHDSKGKGLVEKAHAYRVRFVGSNTQAQYIQNNAYPDYENYYLGNDPSKWKSRVPIYQEAGIKDIYPGIDLWFKESAGELKYEFHAQPGADLTQIKSFYEGVEKPTISQGKLLIHTTCGNVTEQAPVTFEVNKNGHRTKIASAFKVQGKHFGYHFPLGYDKSKKIIIDPTLIFSSYTGSTADNWGFTATPGEAGTAYTAGVVFGGGFPVTPGAFSPNFSGSIAEPLNTYDIGIVKFSADGTQRLFATYLGGNEGETPNSLVVDDNNNLIVMGTTSSNNFPVSNGAFQNTFRGGTFISPAINGLFSFRQGTDIFVTKLNATGTNLLASTYIGGTANDGVLAFNNEAEGRALVKNYGDSYRGDVITDRQGFIYVASNTSSTNFPTANAIQNVKRDGKDAVVFKLSPNLNQMVWSTYYGGDGMDAFYSIQIDRDQNIILGGGTSSNNLQGVNGAVNSTYGGQVDGMVVKLRQTPTLALTRATYIGTELYDQVYFVQLDTAQQIYLFGQTLGQFPVTPGVYSNPNSKQFLQKLNSNLNASVWSTVFGSGSAQTNISPTAFLVDTCAKLYISGWGGSTNQLSGYVNGNVAGMPTTPDALYPNTSDNSDFYFAVFAPNAESLVYGSYFGSPFISDHVDGGTSRFDKAGVIYQAVCAGCGGSSSFPTTPGVAGPNNLSTNCNNALIKINFAQLRITLDLNVVSFCSPASVSIIANSPEGQKFFWNFGDGTLDTTNSNSNVHNYLNPGVYTVSVIAENPSACPNRVEASQVITILPTPAFNDTTLYYCDTGIISLSTNVPPGLIYSWSPGNLLPDSTVQTPQITIDSSITFRLTATNAQGCSLTRNVKVVDGRLSANVTASPLQGCQPLTVNFQSQLFGADSVIYIIADTGVVINPAPNFAYTIGGFGNGSIQVRIFGEPNCANKDTFDFPFQINAAPLKSDTLFRICNFDDTFSIQPATSPLLSVRWLNPINLSDSVSFQVTVNNAIPIIYKVLLTDSLGCSDTAKVVLSEGRLRAQFVADTNRGCAPLNISFTDASFNVQEYRWFILPEGTLISETNSAFATFNTPGDYNIRLVATNSTSCAVNDTFQLKVSIGAAPKGDSLFKAFCPGDTLIPSLLQGPGYTYRWSPTVYVSDSTSGNAFLIPFEPTSYRISITDTIGCIGLQTLDLERIRLSTPIITTDLYDPCNDIRRYSFTTEPQDDVRYRWRAVNELEGVLVEDIFPANGNYNITIYAQKGRCIDSLTVPLEINKTPSPLKPNFDTELIFKDCNGIPAIRLINKSENAVGFEWLLPDQSSSREETLVFQPTEEGRQLITLVAKDNNCERSYTPNLAVNKIEVPNLITPNGDGKNDNFSIKGLPAPYGVRLYDRWGKSHFKADDYQNNWPGDAKTASQIYYYHILINNELKCKGWLQVAK